MFRVFGGVDGVIGFLNVFIKFLIVVVVLFCNFVLYWMSDLGRLLGCSDFFFLFFVCLFILICILFFKYY